MSCIDFVLDHTYHLRPHLLRILESILVMTTNTKIFLNKYVVLWGGGNLINKLNQFLEMFAWEVNKYTENFVS